MKRKREDEIMIGVAPDPVGVTPLNDDIADIPALADARRIERGRLTFGP
mgnify:CR=1 FL=1